MEKFREWEVGKKRGGGGGLRLVMIWGSEICGELVGAELVLVIEG
jgi:hypothetical protein